MSYFRINANYYTVYYGLLFNGSFCLKTEKDSIAKIMRENYFYNGRLINYAFEEISEDKYLETQKETEKNLDFFNINSIYDSRILKFQDQCYMLSDYKTYAVEVKTSSINDSFSSYKMFYFVSNNPEKLQERVERINRKFSISSINEIDKSTYFESLKKQTTSVAYTRKSSYMCIFSPPESSKKRVETVLLYFKLIPDNFFEHNTIKDNEGNKFILINKYELSSSDYAFIEELKRIANSHEKYHREFFEIEVKGGHVGVNHYIPIKFYIAALDKNEAKNLCSAKSRVKHSRDDRFLSVRRITKNEYIEGRFLSSRDPYKRATNKQEQGEIIHLISDRIVEEKNIVFDHKKKKFKRNEEHPPAKKNRLEPFNKRTRTDWKKELV